MPRLSRGVSTGSTQKEAANLQAKLLMIWEPQLLYRDLGHDEGGRSKGGERARRRTATGGAQAGRGAAQLYDSYIGSD